MMHAAKLNPCSSSLQLSGSNFLGGSVPAPNSTSVSVVSALGCELWVLQLQYNQLSGSIPDMSDMPQLVSLNLAYNGLTGT